MGYNPQESLENPINTMDTLLGLHPIVPWDTLVTEPRKALKVEGPGIPVYQYLEDGLPGRRVQWLGSNPLFTSHEKAICKKE